LQAAAAAALKLAAAAAQAAIEQHLDFRLLGELLTPLL
jgi:hypothetical protein